MERIKAELTIRVTESEDQLYTFIKGLTDNSMDKWDKADVVSHLCKSFEITPWDVILWDDTTKTMRKKEDGNNDPQL